MNNEIGSLIKIYRKRKGYTQKQLGELTGIADSNIRKYENGRQKPKFETLVRIADALGIFVMDLMPDMYNITTMEPISDENELRKYTLNNMFDKLNEIGKDKVLDYTNDLTKIHEYRQEPSPGPGHDPAADPDPGGPEDPAEPGAEE